MKNLNFHFTGELIEKNNQYFSGGVDQSRFKAILEENLESPNLIFSHYKNIAKHLGNFYQSGLEDIKTDISGIIVPVCHGDFSDYFHIATSIEGDFAKDLKYIWKENGITEEHPSNNYVLRVRAGLTENFISKTFNIPLFESFRHIPGYRNTPLVEDDTRRFVDERIGDSEIAFEKWVKKNFSK